MEIFFFLALIPTPPALVTGVASMRLQPICGSPHLHSDQRRFSRAYGKSDLHESLWQGLEPGRGLQFPSRGMGVGLQKEVQ